MTKTAKRSTPAHLLVAYLPFQWHRTPTTQETDGFQVKRPGDVSVRCTLLLMLDYQVRGRRLHAACMSEGAEGLNVREKAE